MGFFKGEGFSGFFPAPVIYTYTKFNFVISCFFNIGKINHMI